MVRIAHEAPLVLMPTVQKLTDFDYALAPVVLSNDEYKNYFLKQSLSGREVWLDTGVFEEGKPRSDEEMLKCIGLIKPTHVIYPDVLEDAQASIDACHRFKKFLKINNINNIQLVGAIQGKSPMEIKWCYQMIAPLVDKIAIPFDFKAYNEYADGEEENIFQVYCKGRVRLINELASDGIIDRSKPHHLLGCSLPQEFSYYRFGQKDLDCRQFNGDYYVGHDFIDSIDTSNPVVAGIFKKKYQKLKSGWVGFTNKETTKLVDFMNHKDFDNEQLFTIGYNISTFRQIVKGYNL